MYGVRLDVSKRSWHPRPSSIGPLGVQIVGSIVSVCRVEILLGVVTRPHNSVEIEGVMCTMTPLVVVEGPLLMVEGLMLRTACKTTRLH